MVRFARSGVGGFGAARALTSRGGGAVVGGSITGTQKLSGGTPVAGGEVELWTDAGGGIKGIYLASAIPDGNGVYTFSDVDPDDYVVIGQPPATHAMATGESAPIPVTVSGSPVTGVDIIVAAAYFHDTLQPYTDTTDLLANFGAGKNPATSIGAGGSITLDATGGPGGTKAMKYTFGDQTGASCAANYKVQYRLHPGNQPNSSEIWFRWYHKFELNYQNGKIGCSRDKKMLLAWFNTGDADNAEAYVGLTDGPDPYRINMIFDDMAGHHLEASISPGKYTMPATASWTGAYHTWVLGMVGINTTNFSGTLYYDGTQILQLTGQFVNGTTTMDFMEWGANHNNGPEREDYEWWREVGIYTGRPRLIA